jgi:FAD/FMN-containing dehydrogenase
VSAIIASGVVPAALEMMDGPCVRAVEASIYAAGYPTDAAAVLLVELDGRPEAVAAEEVIVAEFLRRHGATTLRSAATPEERARLWQGRKKAFWRHGRLTRDVIVQDAVVPRSVLPDVLDRIMALSRDHRSWWSMSFTRATATCTPISVTTAVTRAGRARPIVSRAIMEVCVAAGGSITGEHGCGQRQGRVHAAAVRRDHARRDVRRAPEFFDPEGRANPGKVIPVHSCREWRAGGN